MVQRTFTIVPPVRPVERAPVENRPMTSKQVRKAYQKANRVPRVSKAELLRQERAEQERIRKEYEKEKAASKARTLREKKRAKELADREDKRKKGLPLVNVRPSQDTIARFVRGNGLGNKRDCKGRDAITTPVLPIVEESEEDNDDLPSPKRLCNQEKKKEEDCEEAEEEEEEEEKEVKEEETEEKEEEKEDREEKEEKGNAPALEGPSTKIDIAPMMNEHIPEDDFLEGFEIMSDDEISKLSFNQITPRNSVGNTTDCLPADPGFILEGEERGHSHHEITLHKLNSPISVKNPKPTTLQEFDLISDDEEDLEQEMLALDVALNTQKQLSKQPTKQSILDESLKPARTATDYELDLGLATDPLNENPREPHCTKQKQACSMQPPPIPAAPQRSHSPESPVAMRPQAPPLSTQQILFNMDDFFPSSSQQAAELEEETIFIPPSMKSYSIPQPRISSPAKEKDAFSSGTVYSSPELPKPFFTSSGTNERLAVALLRSRQTAGREEEQRRRALRLEALELEEAKKKEAERHAREKRLADSKLETKATSCAPPKTKSCEKRQGPRQPRPVAATTPQFSSRKGFTTNPNRTPANTSVQRTPLVETRANGSFPIAKPPPATEMKKPSPLGNLARQQPSSRATKIASKSLPPKTQNEEHKTSQNLPNKEHITSPGLIEAKHLMASQESEFGGSWMDELATEFSI